MKRCRACDRISPAGPQCQHCQAPFDVPTPAYAVRPATPMPGELVSPPLHAGSVPSAPLAYRIRGLGIATVVSLVASTLANTALGLFPFLGPVLTTDLDTLAVGYAGYAAIGLSVFGLWLITAVLFITWLWRARKNLDPSPCLGAGWAIGGWFIPFANFVIPFRVVREVATESVHAGWVGPTVGFWWAALLVDNVLSRIAPEAPDTADLEAHAEWFATDAIFGSISTVLVLVAGGCLTAIVLRVSREQERNADQGWDLASAL